MLGLLRAPLRKGGPDTAAFLKGKHPMKIEINDHDSGLYWDEDAIIGGVESNYHIFAVAQFPRAKEDGPCEPIITSYNSSTGEHEHWRPINPSARRDGLVILLGAEDGGWLELCIQQDRGHTAMHHRRPDFAVRAFRRSRGVK
jgi:hypothetical protein